MRKIIKIKAYDMKKGITKSITIQVFNIILAAFLFFIMPCTQSPSVAKTVESPALAEPVSRPDIVYVTDFLISAEPDKMEKRTGLFHITDMVSAHRLPTIYTIL